MVSKEESLKKLTKVKTNKQGKPIYKNGKPVVVETIVPSFETNDHTFMKVSDGHSLETIEVFTRKTRPAKQAIQLSEMAYEQIISDYVPYKYKGKVKWKDLTNRQKIKWHCESIASALGGTLESFKVFDWFW